MVEKEKFFKKYLLKNIFYYYINASQEEAHQEDYQDYQHHE